jgi:hypothetical protein
MEVAGVTERCILVITRRHGTDLCQLICDNERDGYYIHHRKSGKLVCYDWAALNLGEATEKYEEYYSNLVDLP